MIFYDPVFLLITVVFGGISMLAAARVRSVFGQFAKVRTRSGISGAEAAGIVLRHAALPGLHVERVDGFLSDHYDPRTKTLRLSPAVYDGHSVAAVAVAAHEAGHAMQDARGYAPLKLRSTLVPAASFGSKLWMLPFMLGLFTGLTGFIWVSIGLFAAVVLFQLITLPTEFDASSRAKAVLIESGVVAPGEEAAGVAKVLNAAAMTYVAAALTAIVQLLYLLMRARE
jgi:Zn-dependent membrane protease YugP